MAFIDSLPKDMKDPAYDAAVLNAIRSGNFEISWGEVTSEANGHNAVFRVFADALKIEGVRIDVSARLEQQIADLLGCMLLTPKLADLIWYQRNVTLAPVTMVHVASDTQYMSTTAWMVKHSASIDAQLAAQGNPSGLLCSVGKHWVITNLLAQHAPMAINYGWENTTSGPSCVITGPCHAIQDPGWAHDPGHIDYSQTCVLVSRICWVDGHMMDLSTLLSTPDFAPLASHEGVVRALRQTNVQEAQAIVAKLPCVGPNCPQLVSWVGTSEALRPSVKILLLTGGALVLAVGGFFGMMALAGGAAKRNPIETEVATCECGHNKDTHAKIHTQDEFGNRGIQHASCLGFFCQCKGYKPALRPEKAWRGYQENPVRRRPRRNPVQMSAEPISPYTFEYRGITTVFTKKGKKSNRWCYVIPGHEDRAPHCETSFRSAIVDVKNIVDALTS